MLSSGSVCGVAAGFTVASPGPGAPTDHGRGPGVRLTGEAMVQLREAVLERAQ
jgi:hypothetical protein